MLGGEQAQVGIIGKRWVIEDRELARSLGEAGRARVEAEFGVALMVERFAALYEQLSKIRR